MKLTDYLYFNGITRRTFSKRVDMNNSYLSRVCVGAVKPSPKLCRQIERATQGNVTLRDLRPDLFENIVLEEIVNEEIQEKIG